MILKVQSSKLQKFSKELEGFCGIVWITLFGFVFFDGIKQFPNHWELGLDYFCLAGVIILVGKMLLSELSDHISQKRESEI